MPNRAPSEASEASEAIASLEASEASEASFAAAKNKVLMQRPASILYPCFSPPSEAMVVLPCK